MVRNLMLTTTKNILDSLGYEIKKKNKSLLHVSNEINKLDGELGALKLVNIGAGNFRHHNWVNLDIKTQHNIGNWNKNNIEHDLMTFDSVPLADKSVGAFYCSHVVEHLPDTYDLHLFSEVHRCLADGGTFRVVCPDLSLALRAYSTKDWLFFEDFYSESIPSLEHGLTRFFATQIVKSNSKLFIRDSEIKQLITKSDSLMSFCKDITGILDLDYQKENPNDHINWFTEQKLTEMLSDVGFSDIRVSRPWQSFSPSMRDRLYFDNTLPAFSLFIEATR